jgi:hypothetical protein
MSDRKPSVLSPARPRTAAGPRRYFNKAERGGPFAAREEPQLFSEELRAAFRSLHG